LSVGWLGLLLSSSCSLSIIERTPFLSKRERERERQLALFLTKEIEASERELLLCLRDRGREPPLGSGSRVAGPPSVVELLPPSRREKTLFLSNL
jgi:hypothetical protein